MSSQTDLPADARPTAIDHVQLAAPPGCEQQARNFYGGLLGLNEIEKPDPLRARGGVWFGLGTGQLHIGVENDFAPARKAHPALSVPAAGIDALAERLQAAGVPVKWDLALADVRRFFTEDPWRNRLELVVESAGPDSIEDLRSKSSAPSDRSRYGP
jgi:catechol 2,3-dioxygenase-like lactoylglutathione lyase family enzyme